MSLLFSHGPHSSFPSFLVSPIIRVHCLLCLWQQIPIDFSATEPVPAFYALNTPPTRKGSCDVSQQPCLGIIIHNTALGYTSLQLVKRYTPLCMNIQPTVALDHSE